MKMKPEHYEVIKQAIKSSATLQQVIDHKAFIVAEGKAKDIDKRLRRDAFHFARLSQYASDTLYGYLNDTHIDSALKKIMQEVFNV